jgi:hypothetical protein
MSKKYRKQKRKGSILRAVVFWVIGLGLIVTALFTFRSNNPAEVSGGTPAISVDRQMIDYGDLADFTKITFTITVTNTGTGMLRFSETPYVEVLEGCCPPELTIGRMVLAPGESTTVRSAEFFMHPGMDGKHNYGVHLITNDPAQPDLVVTVLSNWSE